MKHHLINPFANFLLLSPIFIHAEDTLSICAGDVNDPNHPETCSTSSLFVQVENGLKNPKYDQTEVIYDFKKERYQMPIPDFVPVFEIQGDMESHSLIDLAKSARDVIDDNLPSSGAVLFRNLHQKIKEASDFKEFWDGVTVSEQKGNWTSLSYLTNHKRDRTQKSGVDTADNNPSRNPLSLHNELAYDPKPPSRIAFYCMHEGDGGDTTLLRNKEFSRKIPEEMKEFVKSHGGVLNERNFRSDPSEEPESMSWQHKTGTTTREEVIEYFVRRGWKEEDMSFKMSGGIDLKHLHSGFIEDETGEEIWFNAILPKNTKTADGLLMPKEMRKELIQLARDSTSSFRLKQGDWLVLDNFKVMHGRTQYKDITPEMPRTLLVVYTEQ